MAQIAESGHAKNVANFDDLLSFVQGYGESYNPTREALKLLTAGPLAFIDRDPAQNRNFFKLWLN